MDIKENNNKTNKENRCELCKRYSSFLIPKYSNKKGDKGWKVVCRVCYDRLLEYDKHNDND